MKILYDNDDVSDGVKIDVMDVDGMIGWDRLNTIVQLDRRLAALQDEDMRWNISLKSCVAYDFWHDNL
jgi:hypothetical protein